jgi:23S rRNA (guanosine2251-2'-O)-methyltransferase
MKRRSPSPPQRSASRPESPPSRRPVEPAGGAEAGEVIWGLQAVRAELETGPGRIFKVVAAEGRRDARLDALIALARVRGVPVTFGPRRSLDRLTAGGSHQGVAARLAPAAWYEPVALLEEVASRGLTPLLVALDEVQDPHNLGAVARSAEAMGAHGLILPRHRSAAPDGAAAKAAAGALSRLPLCRAGNLARELEALRARDLWIIGTASEEGTPPWEMDLTIPLVLVIGGEEKGVRPVVRGVCDAVAAIPLPGRTSSLNASVAAGIMLYEILRQRERSNRAGAE